MPDSGIKTKSIFIINQVSQLLQPQGSSFFPRIVKTGHLSWTLLSLFPHPCMDLGIVGDIRFVF